MSSLASGTAAAISAPPLGQMEIGRKLGPLVCRDSGQEDDVANGDGDFEGCRRHRSSLARQLGGCVPAEGHFGAPNSSSDLTADSDSDSDSDSSVLGRRAAPRTVRASAEMETKQFEKIAQLNVSDVGDVAEPNGAPHELAALSARRTESERTDKEPPFRRKQIARRLSELVGQIDGNVKWRCSQMLSSGSARRQVGHKVGSVRSLVGRQHDDGTQLLALADSQQAIESRLLLDEPARRRGHYTSDRRLPARRSSNGTLVSRGARESERRRKRTITSGRVARLLGDYLDNHPGDGRPAERATCLSPAAHSEQVVLGGLLGERSDTEMMNRSGGRYATMIERATASDVLLTADNSLNLAAFVWLVSIGLMMRRSAEIKSLASLTQTQTQTQTKPPLGSRRQLSVAFAMSPDKAIWRRLFAWLKVASECLLSAHLMHMLVGVALYHPSRALSAEAAPFGAQIQQRQPLVSTLRLGSQPVGWPPERNEQLEATIVHLLGSAPKQQQQQERDSNRATNESSSAPESAIFGRQMGPIDYVGRPTRFRLGEQVEQSEQSEQSEWSQFGHLVGSRWKKSAGSNERTRSNSHSHSLSHPAGELEALDARYQHDRLASSSSAPANSSAEQPNWRQFTSRAEAVKPGEHDSGDNNIHSSDNAPTRITTVNSAPLPAASERPKRRTRRRRRQHKGQSEQKPADGKYGAQCFVEETSGSPIRRRRSQSDSSALVENVKPIERECGEQADKYCHTSSGKSVPVVTGAGTGTGTGTGGSGSGAQDERIERDTESVSLRESSWTRFGFERAGRIYANREQHREEDQLETVCCCRRKSELTSQLKCGSTQGKLRRTFSRLRAQECALKFALVFIMIAHVGIWADF